MNHPITLSTPFMPALVLGTAALSVASPVQAATLAHRVATTEVTVRAKKVDAAVLTTQLDTASAEEARYYDPALPPATMRITIDKMSTKSAGKALAGSLPLVGLFAGANENRMKGKIELVDTATGKVLRKAKIDCDDRTQFSVADGMFAIAGLSTSFIPFGGLFSMVSDVGRSAANKRPEAQEKLVRGFVMLSYKKLYGDKLYKRFAEQRKAAFAAQKAERAAAATATTPTAVEAPATTAVAPAPATAAPLTTPAL